MSENHDQGYFADGMAEDSAAEPTLVAGGLGRESQHA
jgi:hypothetical protein